mmetsp:Transcript_112105/g.327948  ORF Transcript_112105/g.327948 Transcript_112105/m.327948 type:complete len:240 (+) Transcript_112105:47-766(+)
MSPHDPHMMSGSHPGAVGFISHSDMGSKRLPPGYQLAFKDLNSNCGNGLSESRLGTEATKRNCTWLVPGGIVSMSVNWPRSVAPSMALASTEVSAWTSMIRPKTPARFSVSSVGFVSFAVATTHRAVSPAVALVPRRPSPLAALQGTSSYVTSDIGMDTGLIKKAADALPGLASGAAAAASKAPPEPASQERLVWLACAVGAVPSHATPLVAQARRPTAATRLRRRQAVGRRRTPWRWG